MHTALGAMLPRIINTEQATVNLLRGFAEFTETTADLIDKIEIAISPNATQIYRTTDGKYTSPSIEGLISKIKSDNQEHKYFSTPDFKNLENQTKKLFEEDDISFLEDEDDEDDVLK